MMIRATPESRDMTEFYVTKASVDGYQEIVKFISILTEILGQVMDSPPQYRELVPPAAPQVHSFVA